MVLKALQYTEQLRTTKKYLASMSTARRLRSPGMSLLEHIQMADGAVRPRGLSSGNTASPSWNLEVGPIIGIQWVIWSFATKNCSNPDAHSGQLWPCPRIGVFQERGAILGPHPGCPHAVDRLSVLEPATWPAAPGCRPTQAQQVPS